MLCDELRKQVTSLGFESAFDVGGMAIDGVRPGLSLLP